MKEQLKNYIDLLFAAAPDAADTKQEILQNTLDRYDDLISQGKSPQAAYQLAISGIGDISEILGSADDKPTVTGGTATPEMTEKPTWKKILQAIGICLYILCVTPLFIFKNEWGLCAMFVFIAVATAFMIIGSGKEKDKETDEDKASDTPYSKSQKAVNSLIWTVGLCVYFAVSFTTQAWYITWIIFPLIGAVQGLVKACMDLKEASDHEA